MENNETNESKSNVSILRARLKNAKIDISLWGTGGYKTIEHLAKEIDNNEIILDVTKNGELIRISEVVAAKIFYIDDNGKKYQLIEQKQVFVDGRERIRPSNGQSVFEKMKFGEAPMQAMARGITEELGIGDEFNISFVDEIEKNEESKSYPGLITQSTTYFFEALLNTSQYNSQGYIEVQDDKITYFVWEQIE